MKRTGYECDVCGDPVQKGGWWATFRLSMGSRIRLKLRKWGIVDLNPVGDGWIQRRVDLCDDCWTDVLDEVAYRVLGGDVESVTCPQCGRQGYTAKDADRLEKRGEIGTSALACMKDDQLYIHPK